jgi:hydrogenase expression/formation protein HypD
MKYVDEYRDPRGVARIAGAIERMVTKPWTLMEVCGGQTHTILKYGLDEMLPDGVTLLHGPGCPVCVTPIELMDRAIEIAARPEVIFCSFGDMLRVPGSSGDLLSIKAAGGDVRMVYSPMDALRVAEQNRKKQVVFFAVGFETTAPANALSVIWALHRGITNFSLLVSQVLVPPAIEVLLSARDNRIQALLAAGHVCTVMGYGEYESMAAKYAVPIVVTGFEPLDILQGIYMVLRQLEENRWHVENQYSRAVAREGNPAAREVMDKVFRRVRRNWRGIGDIPDSGLGLREEYGHLDAEKRFDLAESGTLESDLCISGEILQGIKKPLQCPLFGTQCTPESPQGATMVSSEGACAAYYRYRRSGERS